jgi:predicted Zn-dependent protease
MFCSNYLGGNRRVRFRRSRKLGGMRWRLVLPSIAECAGSRFAGGVACVLLWAAVSTMAAHSQASPGGSVDDLLHRGYDLHQQARFAEAIPILEQAHKLAPQDYFANLLLGIDLLRVGRAREAIAPLKMAAQIKNGEEFPEDYLGEAEATLEHPALAAEAYQKAMERGHGSETALDAWAGFCLERFRQIQEMLRSGPRSDVAQKPAETGAPQCTASIPNLERRLALQKVKYEGDTAHQLSSCYAVAASEAAAQLQQKSGDAVAIYRLQGDILLRLKNDPAGAVKEYSDALRERPSDPSLRARLAEAQLAASDPDGAEASAKAALAIDPHQNSALHTLSAIALNNRDYESAMPWLRELAAQDPRDLSIQVQLARALAQTDHAAEALPILQAALRAGYPDPSGGTHTLLASLLRKLGQDQEAGRAETEARRLSTMNQQAAHRPVPEGKPTPAASEP